MSHDPETSHDPLTLRKLTLADLDLADELRRAAGWNQTREDWRMLLDLEPGGCFGAEWEDRPVGTATTTCYGADLAWIGMVLVHPGYRGRGVGKALLGACLEHLRRRGIACIKLDATPAGQPLYESLGFTPDWSWARWKRAGNRAARVRNDEGKCLQPIDWDRVKEADHRIFGVSRDRLCRSLISRARAGLMGIHGECDQEVSGYGLLRPGASGDYLGPLVAFQPDAGRAITRSLLGEVNSEWIYWDIPDRNEDARQLAEALGFQRERPLTRMVLGDNDWPGQPRDIWGLGDPAFG